MARDLTGMWAADDGGTYFVQAVGPIVWWLGQDDGGALQLGTSFTNIFRGAIASETGAPTLLEGQWADVPRGQTMNFGTLALAIEYDDGGNPAMLRRLSETGGFSGSTWTFQSVDVDRSFRDIGDVFGDVIKNTWHADWYDPWDWVDPDRETLADNLDPIKDSVVIYGTLLPEDTAPSVAFVNSFPPDLPQTWDYFVDLNDKYDTAIFNTDSSDADMTCHIAVDASCLPTDLFDGLSDDQINTIQDRLGPIVHPEIVMFAHKDDDPDIAQLPGWAELGGSSVLFNGIPIAGNYQRNQDQSVAWIGAGASLKSPRPGNRVRVTGVLSIDKAHNGSDIELHPVYGIDIIDATARDDWSGVWGDSGRFTYYIHQVLNSIWMLITTPYRDLEFVAVFQGSLQSDGATAVGEWVTVPLGSAVGAGWIQFTLNSSRLKIIPGEGSPLGGRVFQKLYDAEGHPCPQIGKVSIGLSDAAVCQVKEIEGATVLYAAVNPALPNYPDAAYSWTVTGGQVVGWSSDSTLQVIMPAAHTKFTVAVDITIYGACRYHAEHAVVVRTPSEAYREELWCQIRQAVGSLGGSFEEMDVNIPDERTLHRIQKIVDGTSNALHRLRHERHEPRE